MSNIQRCLRSVWVAGVVIAWLWCANVAHADDMTSGSVSAIDDGIGDLPASDLNGWFFNPEPQFLMTAQPDPSQPWTSAANIVTLDYWLSLVQELGDDPSLLQQLYGLGMISSPDLTSTQINQLIVSNQAQPSQPNSGVVPEPVTLELLGTGLALLGFYAAERARRITRGLTC